MRPLTWAIAFAKHPHFPEKDTEAWREQVMHPELLNLQVAEPEFEPKSDVYNRALACFLFSCRAPSLPQEVPR